MAKSSERMLWALNALRQPGRNVVYIAALPIEGSLTIVCQLPDVMVGVVRIGDDVVRLESVPT